MEPEPAIPTTKHRSMVLINFLKQMIKDALKDVPENFSGDLEASKIQVWMNNGKIHREGDMPAVIFLNFERRITIVMYYENGKIHRKNGPAIFSPATVNDPFDNSNLWCINDKIMTKTEHTSFCSVNEYLCDDVSFIIANYASD